MQMSFKWAIHLWAAPGQTRTTVLFSVILVTHPDSYIETTDRRESSSPHTNPNPNLNSISPNPNPILVTLI